MRNEPTIGRGAAESGRLDDARGALAACEAAATKGLRAAAVVSAASVADAADLVLVARRAAEDAEAPVLIVHDGYPASHARDRVLVADGPLCRALLDAEPPRSSVEAERQPAHRRAGQRMPFAISSSLRTFERHAGRPLDLMAEAPTRASVHLAAIVEVSPATT